MLDTPSILHTSAQQTAFIHVVVPRAGIREVMGPGLAELRAVLAAQGIASTGPWLSHHRRMDPEIFDFEISLLVASTVAASGRVRPGELPATQIARTTYRGPYEGLGAAWGEFRAWIAQQGYTPAPDLWECYVSGPDTSPNPQDWCTEMNQPLLSQGS